MIHTQDQLELTTDALNTYHTTQKTLLDNWLTPRAVSKGLGELYHPSSGKEPYSGNGSMTQEQSMSFLSLTPIMSHQENAAFSFHNTGLNPSGTSTEENQ